MRLRFVTARDLRQTFLFPISSVLLFAASIGYKMKKLVLNPDAGPTLFDFSKPTDKEVSQKFIKRSIVFAVCKPKLFLFHSY
jgi:hypothetical protein